MSGFDEIELHECFFKDVSNLCKSAPSAKSAFYRRTDPCAKSTGGKVSAVICVDAMITKETIMNCLEQGSRIHE